MLEIRDLHKDFEGFKAITAVNFSVEEGSRHAIIGPNGAGKTTFFNLITGHLQPTQGSVVYKGQAIVGMPPHKIVKLGIARSFQRINIYPRMSVSENVQVALIAHAGMQFRLFTPAAGLFRDETAALLALVGLADQAGEIAGELAYGRQKQLELAISLAAEPDLLLLDEPTAGMSPSETAESIRMIDRIARERGLTLLFTEHDMSVVFGIADRITVLHHGEILASGLPEEVRNNPVVRSVYLGEEGLDGAA
jgi:branched-chain amino acid transport system ATP-binding protein